MKDSDELIEFDFDEIIHETSRAYLMRVCGEKMWIPKKLCEDSIDFKQMTFTIPRWLADEKGLT